MDALPPERGDLPPSGALPQDSDGFFAKVYDELRSIAHARLRGERTGYTLQSTELVHEAYMRLAPGDGSAWKSRGQFFAAAAEAMRRILIDRARAKGRTKRGGDEEGKARPRVSLNLAEVAAIADDRDPDMILLLDRALERLSKQEERIAQVVKLRFYAGLSVEEVAEILETSPRTILRDWAFARAWLFGELSKE